MPRALVSKLIILTIAAVIIGLFSLAFKPSVDPVVPPASVAKMASSTMSISGFGFSIYQGASLITRVQADLFRIVPRKFGIFRMKSVNEAALTKARFEIYSARDAGKAVEEHPGVAGALGVFSAWGDEVNASAGGLPGMRGMGNVTRLVMDGMQLAFYRGGWPYLEARARNGAMDFKKKKITMQKAVLEHLPSGKKIVSETIIWDDGARLFKIPGRYELITSRGRRKGRGITVDLDFRVKKMSLG